MPVPKSGGRQSNGKKSNNSKGPEKRSDHSGDQIPRTYSPVNGNMDSHHGKKDSVLKHSNGPKNGINGTNNVEGHGDGKGSVNSTSNGNKQDNCRGSKGDAKMSSTIGRNRVKKSGVFPSNNRPGNTNVSASHSNGNLVELVKQGVLTGNSQKDGDKKSVDLFAFPPGLAVTDGNDAEALTVVQNIVAKYSNEEKLSFFQPDFEDEPKSPTVEELCAKWPINEPKCYLQYSNNEEFPTKRDIQSLNYPVQQDSDPTPPVPECVPSNDISSPNSAPMVSKTDPEEANPIQSLVGLNDDTNQPVETSSFAGSRSNLNFSGSSGRSRYSGDSGHTAWSNGQRGSPRKYGPPRFANRNDATTFERDEMYSRNYNQDRWHSAPQNSTARGGQKKKKNGRKSGHQNAYQVDNKKQFGRPGSMQGLKSPMGQHVKTGPPVGYYNNHEAYVGQNLVSSVAPLMGPPGFQPQVMNQMGPVQLQLMNPVGAMQPQMIVPQMDSQLVDGQQCTWTIFQNDYMSNQWVNMGNLPENQQVLVQQANGEVVPLTVAPMMPYVMPYTAGLPNTSVPMMIPAVAPPLGTGSNAQASTNGEQVTNFNCNPLHSDSNGPTNISENYANPNPNICGTNLTNPTADLTFLQSVATHARPISAYSEGTDNLAQPQLEQCGGTHTSQAPDGNQVLYAPINWTQNYPQPNGDQLFDTSKMLTAVENVLSGYSDQRANTPNYALPPNLACQPVSSPVVAERQALVQTPGTSLNGSPSSAVCNTPGTTHGTPTHSWKGTPGAWDITPGASNGTPDQSNVNPGPLSLTPGQLNLTPDQSNASPDQENVTPEPSTGTPKDAPQTGAKGQHNKVKMMSVSQLEKMQR